MKATAKYPYSFTFPAVLLYSIFFVLPTLAGFYFAFTNWSSDTITDWEAVRFTGWENFKDLFAESDFNVALSNTIQFTVVTSVLKILFGLLLALALNQPLRTRNFLRVVFYSPAIFSIIVISLLFSSIFSMDGMFTHVLAFFGMPITDINWLGDKRTAFPIIMTLEVWKWSGFCMMIFLAGLQSISHEYYEAAKIDGASVIQRFRHITLPLLMPAITINVILNLIGGFKVFDQVYVLTNGQLDTHVINTYIFKAFSLGFYGKASAMGLILFVIISVIAVILTTYLKRKEVEL